MITNLPLVDAPSVWLLLVPVLLIAGALGAWVARLEVAYEAAHRFPPLARQPEATPAVHPAAAA